MRQLLLGDFSVIKEKKKGDLQESVRHDLHLNLFMGALFDNLEIP